jgi:Xaa-Pro aminopeptidase
MEYTQWIESEFEELSRSCGLECTPGAEIEVRLAGLRSGMAELGMDGILLYEKMDRFYFSGTTQDGLLFVPLEGTPILMVRREETRARMESPLENILGMGSVRDVPLRIKEHQGTLPRKLGLELDVLPARDYLWFRELFPGSALMDASQIIRTLRMIKSPYEINLIKKAGAIGEKLYERGRTILREGMTEIGFAGLLEAAAKEWGHEGLLRVRSINYEAYTWHVLSGLNGAIVSQSDSPMGGLGLSPAFPVGASLKVMERGEPILVDFGTCYQGYQADETRMFCVGEMPKKFTDAYRACLEIHDLVLDEVKPGTDCEEIFEKTLRLAERMGYKESYLGPPGLKTHFIGHGLGLQLNEMPFLAKGHSYPLEEGMVVAVEPKMVFPGEGCVGVENSVAVTRRGCIVLTPADLGIYQV